MHLCVSVVKTSLGKIYWWVNCIISAMIYLPRCLRLPCSLSLSLTLSLSLKCVALFIWTLKTNIGCLSCNEEQLLLPFSFRTRCSLDCYRLETTFTRFGVKVKIPIGGSKTHFIFKSASETTRTWSWKELFSKNVSYWKNWHFDWLNMIIWLWKDYEVKLLDSVITRRETCSHE